MEEISIDANAEIPTTHIFVYNKKEYPFNFDLFKIFSQYFNSNPPTEEKIDFLDENLNISEGSIPDFINFCQARKITLTKENSPTLHRLSQKFKVPSLLSKTKEFITTHQKEVVVEIITMYRNDASFNIAEYEEIISTDLIKYINDDRLLTLSIPTLYRIIKKYLQKYKIQSDSKNSEQPPELIEFLFKCLNHFGREASVLFDQIDTIGSNGTLINRLLDGYSEIFDFGFVNTGNLRTVYQLENEIIAREKDMKKQFSAAKLELEGMSDHIGKQIELMRKQKEEEMKDKKEMFDQIPKMVAQEMEELRKKHEDVMNEKKVMFDQIPKMVAKEMEELRKRHEDELKKRDDLIANMVKQFETIQTKYQEEMRAQKNEFNEKMKKINEQLEKLMRPKVTRMFSGNHDGLVSLLDNDVSLSAEKKDTNDVSRLRKYDDNNFYNNNIPTPSSESDTIVKFDFGPHKRVDLHSYLIRTAGDNPNGDHPKTWRIEGSNDCQSWTRLDRRLNDGSTNKPHAECHFVCQSASYGSESNLFRYIRYVMEESWHSNSSRKYIVDLTYFELYGSVLTI